MCFSGHAFHQVTRINVTLFTVQCYIKLYYVLVLMCLSLLMLFACYKLLPLYSYMPRPNATQHHFSIIRGVLLQLKKSHVTTAENPKQDLSFLIMIYSYFLPSLYRIILSSILSVRHMAVPLLFLLHLFSVITL